LGGRSPAPGSLDLAAGLVDDRVEGFDERPISPNSELWNGGLRLPDQYCQLGLRDAQGLSRRRFLVVGLADRGDVVRLGERRGSRYVLP
jgi:hypothetical protein